jgi:peptidyl-prolyl cis-trans isomerase B (cyclophilin B)
MATLAPARTCAPAPARRVSRARRATRAAASRSDDANGTRAVNAPSRRDALLAAAAMAAMAPIEPSRAAQTQTTIDTNPPVKTNEAIARVAAAVPQPSITAEAFFDIAVDAEFVGRVVVGVYGDANPIAAARFLALAEGVQGLGYRRTQIDAVEYDENVETKEDTPSFLGSTGIRAFVIPGSTTPVTSLPGGASNEALLPELAARRIGHDDLPGNKVGIVSLVVERGAPPPPPKERLVSVNGKFVKVADPPPPGPNGTAFAVTVAPGAGAVLDRTNVVVGEVVEGLDVLNAIAALPTVKDNSASPFFAVAKTIGDKRATVAEQAFGKPFAKVTVAKCGVVKRETPPAGDVEIAAPPA